MVLNHNARSDSYIEKIGLIDSTLMPLEIVSKSGMSLQNRAPTIRLLTFAKYLVSFRYLTARFFSLTCHSKQSGLYRPCLCRHQGPSQSWRCSIGLRNLGEDARLESEDTTYRYASLMDALSVYLVSYIFSDVLHAAMFSRYINWILLTASPKFYLGSCLYLFTT
jgi:hypothetical protein